MRQNAAAEITLRCERRLGELVAEMPKARGARGAGRPPKGGDRPSLPKSAPTLAEQGISRKQSERWQQIASVPEPEFDRQIASTKAKGLPVGRWRGRPPRELD